MMLICKKGKIILWFSLKTLQIKFLFKFILFVWCIHPSCIPLESIKVDFGRGERGIRLPHFKRWRENKEVGAYIIGIKMEEFNHRMKMAWINRFVSLFSLSASFSLYYLSVYSSVWMPICSTILQLSQKILIVMKF